MHTLISKKNRSAWIYLKTFKFNSILLHNFITIVIFVVVPITLLTMFYTIHLRKTTDKELAVINLEMLRKSSDIIDTVFNEMESFAYMLSINHNTKLFTFLEADQIESSGCVSNLQQTINLYTKTFEYVESIYIYSEDNSLFISNNDYRNIKYLSDTSWMEEYRGMTSRTIAVSSRLKNNFYPYYITLIYPVTSSSKKEGAIVLNINVEQLAKLVDTDMNSIQELYIIGDDSRLYYASDVRLLENNTPPKFADFITYDDASFTKIVPLDKEKYFLSFMKSDEYSWNYILTTPVSSYQLKYNELRRFILQVFLSALIIGLMVSFVLANKTFAPLKALMNMLEDFDSTDIKYLTSKNKNETAYIKDVIIHTQAENDTLQLELEQRLKKLNEAQIVMLQNQINPHFMYNTLDTISWAASDKLGVGNEVSDMITTLASLLRISLSRSSYLVSLDEEINHAKLYLKILRLRYKNKLTVHWSIDDDLSECKVLKLSLQPLIENAVNHGLRPKRYLGSIWISCKTIDDFIIISVEDDGVGMDESNIQLLNKQLRDNHPFDGNNVGIHNVNQRIRIIFGEEYGIYISGREQGLTVSIKCPLIR